MDEVYQVIFSKNSQQIWSIELNNRELVAGMLAVGMAIMSDINTTDTTYMIDSNVDVSDFRQVTGIYAEDIDDNSIDRLHDGEYGIWMANESQYKYSLFIFTCERFFQGIISLCNGFSVDFRNYIYGLPFDVYGNQYALDGYVMTQYQVAVDTVELNDVEDEARDNENIITPLERTEIIVTIKDSML